MRTHTIALILILLIILGGLFFFGKSTQAPSTTPEENQSATSEVQSETRTPPTDGIPVLDDTPGLVENPIAAPPGAPVPLPPPESTPAVEPPSTTNVMPGGTVMENSAEAEGEGALMVN